jgi:1-phosphofructokinase family hexose kinase
LILTVTPNPSVDHALFVDQIRVGRTNRAVSVERDAGGKGINISRVLVGLEESTLATGFLGGGTGAYVRHTLDHEGVPHDFVTTRGETRINFEVEDGSGGPPTCFNEPGPQISDLELRSLFGHVELHLPGADWIVLAGSLPPGVPSDLFRRLGTSARGAKIRFAVDADGEVLRLALSSGASFIKPNEEEAARLLGVQVVSETEALEAVQMLRAIQLKGGAPEGAVTVISRGAAGAVMADATGVWVGQSPKVVVRSTVGSGDTMVAAMLAALGQGMPPQLALQHGLAAGAATAEIRGGGLARRADVERLQEQAVVARIV